MWVRDSSFSCPFTFLDVIISPDDRDLYPAMWPALETPACINATTNSSRNLIELVYMVLECFLPVAKLPSALNKPAIRRTSSFGFQRLSTHHHHHLALLARRGTRSFEPRKLKWFYFVFESIQQPLHHQWQTIRDTIDFDFSPGIFLLDCVCCMFDELGNYSTLTNLLLSYGKIFPYPPSESIVYKSKIIFQAMKAGLLLWISASKYWIPTTSSRVEICWVVLN